MTQETESISMDLASINENGRRAEVTWCGFTKLRVASVTIGALYSARWNLREAKFWSNLAAPKNLLIRYAHAWAWLAGLINQRQNAIT